jgi:pentose-5-phosphate-3-epimerase
VAGADLLVSGSAIFWNDDPAAAFRELAQIAAGRSHA